nr:MAG TPA_asm: peptidase [Caudoviricetes sp.]
MTFGKDSTKVGAKMTETNQVKLTLEEKERLADYWAKRLQLGDWDIKFNLNASRNQLGEGFAGEARLNEVTKKAVILILREEDFDNEIYTFPFEFECTLVHELLHLKLCLIESDPDNELRNRVVHQLLDELAKALVDKTHCPVAVAEGNEVTADEEA